MNRKGQKNLQRTKLRSSRSAHCEPDAFAALEAQLATARDVGRSNSRAQYVVGFIGPVVAAVLAVVLTAPLTPLTTGWLTASSNEGYGTSYGYSVQVPTAPVSYDHFSETFYKDGAMFYGTVK